MRVATLEQKIAIDAKGRVIVSASAGSGKTFVMIQKLVKYLVSGGDLDEVLCVTFTKKAAAQMKEKLRSGVIAQLERATDEEKARLKSQLAKISTADISTIHSFLAKLLRTYYYILDLDAGFEMMSSDDAEAKRLQERAMDNVFDSLYEKKDADFLYLLDRYTKKRSDKGLKELVLSGYRSVRSLADYDKLLLDWSEGEENETFEKIKAAYNEIAAKKFRRLLKYVEKFEGDFLLIANNEKYEQVFEAVKNNLKLCIERGIFHGVKTIFSVPKPKKLQGEDEGLSTMYTDFRDEVKKKFEIITSELMDEENERERFIRSCPLTKAFTRLVMAFDGEYMAVKGEESKLDYNDLEHFALKLLRDKKVLKEVREKYIQVYVDEYQDVNPIQEEIISAVGGNVFLVGDVKQAIYGFRGSKSAFFKDKFVEFETSNAQALELNKNFRSTDEVLEFVNRIFSKVITPEFYGLQYSPMYGGVMYPKGAGKAEICTFDGKDEVESVDEVYSVLRDSGRISHSKEGLAVLALVKEELAGKHFDLEKGEFVETKPSDICILVRKGNDATRSIIKTLYDAGYSVSSAGNVNICELPEVANMLDILSYLDNSSQDIPLVAALLSLGRLDEEELAKIKIFSQSEKVVLSEKKSRYLNYFECCKRYMERIKDDIAKKLVDFFAECERLRGLLPLLSCDKIIDEILAIGGMEAELSTGGGDKLRNVLTLAENSQGVSVSQFLYRLRQSGNEIKSAQVANSESIKVMTLHSSKGLEFPVVIISDISKTYEGDNRTPIRFDDKFGFATKYFNVEERYTSETLLRELERVRQKDDDLLNEINLFYVGCTRAMSNLHILTSKVPKFSPYFDDTRTYADLFDVESFSPRVLNLPEEFGVTAAKREIKCDVDEALIDAIESKFMRAYPHTNAILLPVKSSATALLKGDDEEHFISKQLFGGEGETNTEKGTAYHRFLELCSFSEMSESEIAGELEGFVERGEMPKEQADLLDVTQLKKILSMPAFKGIADKKLLREQEFLCRVKACDVLDTQAEDYILLQGAIDLLIIDGDNLHIVDYKYSHLDDESLKKKYFRQLDIYKMAVKTVLGEDKEVTRTLLNIFACRQIDFDL